MNIIFAGTPAFSSQLLASLLTGPHNLVCVLTQPDRPSGRGRKLTLSPVKAQALAHNIPLLQPTEITSSTLAHLETFSADVMLVIAYGLILPAELLTLPRLGCVNLHTSLLPRWRGAAPIQRAIEANDRYTGVTLMKMDAGLDTGHILTSHRCQIAPNETGYSLEQKLIDISRPLLNNALTEWQTCKTLTGKPQDHNKACYAAKVNKHEAALDWSLSAQTLACKIRAFNPAPVCFSHLTTANAAYRIRIWDATPVANPATPSHEGKNAPPGTIVHQSNTHLYVTTGDGLLALTHLQWPGGNRLPITDILKSKAAHLTPGTRFNP